MFTDRLFTLAYLPEESLSFSFQTEISENRAGNETRVAKRTEPLISVALDSTIVNTQQLRDLQSFKQSIGGSVNTFKYKSQIEYRTTSQGLYHDNGTEEIASQSYGKLIYDASSSKWRAFKVWELRRRAYPHPVRRGIKAVRHIDLSTFVLYQNSVQTTNYNYEGNGVFSLPVSSPTDDIRFDCEYFLELRFNSDLNYELIAPNTYRLSNIVMTEEVHTSLNVLSHYDFSSFNPTANLTDVEGVFFDWKMLIPLPPTTHKLTQGVLQSSLQNERDFKRAVSNSNKTNTTLESNVLDHTEKDYLLSWFMVMKGRLSGFIYEAHYTRFDSDTLTFSSVSSKSECTYFKHSSIEMLQQCDNVKNVTMTPVFYINTRPTQVGFSQQACTDIATNYVLLAESCGLPAQVSPAVVYPNNTRWLRWCVERANLPANQPAIIFIFITSSVEYYNLVNGDFSNTTAYTEDIAYFLDNAKFGDRYVIVNPEYFNGVTQQPSDVAAYKFLYHLQSILWGDLQNKLNNRVNQFTIAGKYPLKIDTLVSLEKAINSFFACQHSELALAYCLKLTGTGATLGFTSLNADLSIEGLLYESRSVIESSAVSSDVKLSTDNLEITSLISSDRVTEPQLISGFWDDALVELKLIDFVRLPSLFTDGLPLLSGQVGRVSIMDGKFVLEVRSLSELLNLNKLRKASPQCHYIFGDNRCGLNLVSLGLQYDNVLITSVGVSNILELSQANVDSRFINGVLLPTSGVNKGIKLEVIATDVQNQQIVFKGDLAGSFEVGDLVNLVAYCKKDQQTCLSYNNYTKFGGIPIGGNFMPGLDRITVSD